MNNGQEKRPIIPDAPLPTPTSGNLLSNVAPPSELPSFITSTAPSPSTQTVEVPKETQATDTENVMSADNFSPAIPAEKGEPTLPIRTPDSSQTAPMQTPAEPPVERFGDAMPGSGLLTWMKGAVSGGGILHKVAEKAKNSVDSIVTTLDPQMKDFLNGGTDINIAVTTDDEGLTAPIKEAFQAVFGRVNIISIPSHSETAKVEPIGPNAACAIAKQKTASARCDRPDFTNNTPILAMQNFVHEYLEHRWYSQDMLLLTQQSLNIELHQYTQPTQVPISVINSLKAATPDDFEHIGMGFKDNVADFMAPLLQTEPSRWQEASTGVARRDAIYLAAKSIAGSYKNLLALSSMDTI